MTRVPDLVGCGLIGTNCSYTLVCPLSRLGESVSRGKTVDLFGDTVRSAAMSGDGFRTRHDSVKNFLHRQMKFAGISVVCEVFGLFAREIPQEGLS